MTLRSSPSAKPAGAASPFQKSPVMPSPSTWASTVLAPVPFPSPSSVAAPTQTPALASTSSSPPAGRATLSAIAIVDTGPLYAAADERDSAHERSIATLQRPDLHLIIPALVIAEASYLVAQRLGPRAEAAFIRGLVDFDVEAPTRGDWTRIAELMERYVDFPLGATDASVVALTERLDTDLVITLDHRHFAAIRPSHRTSLTLLPT